MTLRDGRTPGVLVVGVGLVVALGLVVGGSAVLTTAAPLTGAPLTTAPFDGAASSGTAAATGAAPTEIDSCTTIQRPGTYVLTADVENGGGTPISKACVKIVADGVTFDGGGHLLDGRGESHTKGVAVVGAEGVTVRNVAVDDWHSGVLVESGSATIRNVRTFSNAYGVRLENATGGVTVENSTIEENLVGVSAVGENVTLSGNEFSGNEIEVQRE